MHGEDYICLGFLFGEKFKVAYISDVSRFPSSTEYGEYKFSPLFSLETRTYMYIWVHVHMYIYL